MPSNMGSTTPPHLSSLRRYASNQSELINPLISPNGLFRGLDWHHGADTNWVKLRGNFWPVWSVREDWDTTRDVIRGSNPLNDSLLPDVVPAKCDVMDIPDVVNNCWNLESKECIFIRSEYKEAEEFALSACSDPRMNRVLAIIGQPGIGTSLSAQPPLAYMLGSFIREICTYSSSPLAPPCVRASHCATDPARSRPTVLRRRCSPILSA